MFYSADAHDCSYLKNQQQRNIFTLLDNTKHTYYLHHLLKSGFRRSHHMAYFPACHHCQQCLSLRVLVNDFQPSKSQKRILNKNNHLNEQIIRDVDDYKPLYQLFQHYINTRHENSDMRTFGDDEFIAFIAPQFNQYLHCYFDDEKLVGVMITDWFDDALSAIYSFFDPNYHQSLGSYMILRLIDIAKQHDLQHVYLGYYIEKSKKMAYKTNYRPFEIYQHGDWHKL